MKKRLLSMLLAVVMVLTMLPVSVLAEGLAEPSGRGEPVAPKAGEPVVVRYYGNGGAYNGETSYVRSQTASPYHNQRYIVLEANQFTRDGYEFQGWAEKADAKRASYDDEDYYALGRDQTSVTLYAVWEKKKSGYSGLDSKLFGWNISGNITANGSASMLTPETAYDAVSGLVTVYYGAYESEAAAKAANAPTIPIGGYGSDPSLSSYTIGQVKEAGLTVVVHSGLIFARSSICCDDGHGYSCQTAASGNAGHFNNVIGADTTILTLTPAMLSANGVFHTGAGSGNWLMLTLAGEQEYTVIYMTRIQGQTTYAVDKIVTLHSGDTIPDYTASLAGYTFDGWYENEALTKAWEKPSGISSNIIVYGEFVPVPVESVAVVKTADKTMAKTGETVTYTVKVTNDGNVDLTDVQVTDSLAGIVFEDTQNVTYAGGVFTIKSLPVGVTETITYTYTIPEGVTSVKNVAVSGGVEDEVIVTVENPDYTVTKTVTIGGVQEHVAEVGETLQYTITVTNTGNVALSDIALTDTMTVNGEVVSNLVYSHSDNVTYADGVFTIAELAVGASETITYSYTAKQGDKTVKNVVISGDRKEEVVVEVLEPQLTVTKTTSQKEVQVGDTITWTITVENKNDYAVTGITLEDILYGGEAAIANAGVVIGGYDGPFDLAAGASKSFTATYEVQPSDAGKTLINGIVAKVDGEPAGEDESEPVKVPTLPDISVVKEVTAINGEAPGEELVAEVGDVITWTITITNSGETDGVVTVEDVLNGKTLELTPAAEDGTYTVPAGSSIELTAAYTVQQSDSGKTLVNHVRAGDKGDDAPGVDVEQTPGLRVEKEVYAINGKKVTGSSFKVEPGDTVTWQITVLNNGQMDLEDIAVSDLLTIGKGSVELVLYKGSVIVKTVDLKVGESVALYADYKVKASDQGQTLVNTVTASADVPGKEDPRDSDVNSDVKVVDGKHRPALNLEDHVAYVIGYEDDTVRPQNNITRAEVATIFFRLLTDESRAYYWSQTNDYSDVTAGDWYNNAISTMANAGIVTGYPDGTFRPNAPITRAEFAAIAARFSDVVYNGKCSFSDVLKTFWGYDKISLAEHLGWITGYPDNTFRPDNDITRAEAMTLINRVLERAVEEEHMLPDMVKWRDNDPDAWYYEAVQEATNSHDYTRLKKVVPGQDFCYEDWVHIDEVPDWAALERSWSDAYDHR